MPMEREGLPRPSSPYDLFPKVPIANGKIVYQDDDWARP